MPFLFLLYFILEIYVLVEVWQRFGFVNTFFALAAGAVLGLGLIRNQGRELIRSAQMSLAQGQTPSNEILHGALIFLAGFFFLIPGFISDAVALCLILPGTRHLAALFFKRKFSSQMRSGNFRVFTFGGGAGGFRPPGPGQAASPWPREERDVSPHVIDVSPISTESREKDTDDPDSQS